MVTVTGEGGAAVAKAEGNAAFKEGNYRKAVECYIRGLEFDPNNAALWANRAMCEIRLEEYGSAVESCTRALEHDPGYYKCLFRRATALCGIAEYAKALPDFQQAVALAPQDAAARQKLAECRKMTRYFAFQRAIAVEDQKSVLETLDIDSMPDNDDLGPLPDKVDMAWVRKLADHFREQKRVSRKKVYQIVKRAMELFEAEPTMTDIDPSESPVTVCGDTHGQYYDLLHIFEEFGWPSEQHTYLFNGDFVDRGSWSTEVALVLYAMKIALPQNLYINRGNHETDSMNVTYGFSGECKSKYTSDHVFTAFSESFSKLPLASLIGNAFLVMHGGLFSKDGVTLDDIRSINRFAQRQPDREGLMMELLWADPQPQPGRLPSKRGVGLQFGPDVTARFCDQNKLKAVIRSHEVRDNGYEIEHSGRLVTVFSAPNYCDSTGNLGAIINIGADLEMAPKTFRASPHPNIPPMAYASGIMR